MSIRKRNGKYQVRVSIGNGQRLEVTLPAGATPRDAKLQEAKLLRQKIDVQNGVRPRVLIDEALTTWEDSGARLLKSYERDLKYRIAVLREHFTAGRYLEELEEVAAKVRKVGVKAGAAPATTNRLLAILRRIGKLNKVDCTIEMMPGEISREIFLTADQIQKLCEHADYRLVPLIHWQILTGLRLGESLSLTPANIQDGYVILHGRKTKSGRPRAVPLEPYAAQIAEQCIPFQLGRSNVHKLFNEARIAAGMREVRKHDLRHTFASSVLRTNGGNLAAARDLLGHSSLAVTSRYAHCHAQHLKDSVSEIGSALGLRKSA